MTTEEIMTLAGREFDKAVAVEVLGWERGGLGDRNYWWCDPGWCDDRPHSLRVSSTPKFHADAAADYEVLKRVHGTWAWEARKRFAEALRQVQMGRVPVPLAGTGYEPGDYSRAALLALLGPGRRGAGAGAAMRLERTKTHERSHLVRVRHASGA